MSQNAPLSQDVRDAVKRALVDREQAEHPDHIIAVAVALHLDDQGNIPVVVTRAKTIAFSVPPDYGQ